MPRPRLAIPAGLFLVSASLLVTFGVGGIYWKSTDRTTRSPEGALPSNERTSGSDHKAQVGLSESARKFIWEAENRAFQISYKAAPLLTRALAEQDHSAVAAFFAADFQGQLCTPESIELVRREFAEFGRAQESDRQFALSRDQFVDRLLDYVALFSSPPKVQLPLMNLTPTKPNQLDGAWKGTWIMRITGQLQAAQRGEVVLRGEFVANCLPRDLAPVRGWISSWNIMQVTVNRATHTLMEEVGDRSGIELGKLHDNWNVPRSKFSVTPGGAYACDYNQDGIIDLLVTDRGRATLYAGRGGAKFEDATIDAGLPLPDTHVVAFCDLDNDGDEDLILGHAILENRHGHFVQRGYLQLAAEATGIAVADYDRDGLVDVYVSNSAPEPRRGSGRTSWVDDQSGVPNRLWRNAGNFRFADVTDETGAAAGRRSSFTSVWLDANDDGWPDLYVINELGPNVLLQNSANGTFREQHIGPKFDGFAMGVAAGDVNGDGRIDLYLGNMFSKAGKRIIANVPADAYPREIIEQLQSFVAGNLLLLNRPFTRFEPSDDPLIAEVGWAYGTALVDLDGDGLLDIHATAGYASFSSNEPDG